MSDLFWISTGDIKQQYVPMGIVTALASAPAGAFSSPKYADAFQNATADLAQQALKMGCNGVVWVHLQVATYGAAGLGGTVFATGTAVKVSAVAS